jgi:hypothetical protein
VEHLLLEVEEEHFWVEWGRKHRIVTTVNYIEESGEYKLGQS